jgi:hypothetical protein
MKLTSGGGSDIGIAHGNGNLITRAVARGTTKSTVAIAVLKLDIPNPNQGPSQRDEIGSGVPRSTLYPS